LEQKATKKQAGAALSSKEDQPSFKAGEASSGPPLLPPRQLDDLRLVDQGASLSFRLVPADSSDQLRFVLTLKAAERSIWREVEHRWTNTLPLLFAFYSDGKAVKQHLSSFEKWGGAIRSEKLVERGHEKRWSLLVDLKSLDAILENRQPHELALVAVFSERQHEGFFDKDKGSQKLKKRVQEREDRLVEPQVPQTAIVVRSNVVYLTRSGDRWKIGRTSGR
jgi:hypothetical protein